MKQVVCNFAPLRFLPYREVGEFVNIGVALHSPENDYFGYRLVPAKRTARVSGFFPELDMTVFKAALNGVTREFRRFEDNCLFLSVGSAIPPEIAAENIDRFKELIRRREGLLHFGEPGSLVAASPEIALDQLFGRFVKRQFARKKEYQEVVMRERLAVLLRDWKLDRHYHANKTIGDADFHLVMPFVHFNGETPTKVIKPLDLDKAEPSEIYQHGGTWVKNMERLGKRNHLPPSVVFTVRIPDSGKRLDAANEICSELDQLGVRPVNFSDTQAVRSAATVGIESAF